MSKRIDNDVEIELHDVFNVQQITRDTLLEEAVDLLFLVAAVVAGLKVL